MGLLRHRAVTIFNDDEAGTGIGFVAGLADKSLHLVSPVPMRANLDFYEDGKLVAQERFNAGDVKYVEYTLPPALPRCSSS